MVDPNCLGKPVMNTWVLELGNQESSCVSDARHSLDIPKVCTTHIVFVGRGVVVIGHSLPGFLKGLVATYFF